MNTQRLKYDIRRRRILFLLLFFVVLLTGCVTSEDPLQRDIARLNAEISQLRAELKALKSKNEIKYAELQNRFDSLSTEVKAVDAKAEDVTQRLGENDAKIEKLRQQLQVQNQRISEIEKSVHTQRQKPTRPAPIRNDITGTASPMETMYDDAYQSFTQGNYSEAREKFRAFLKKYPKTVYSDNAQFWIGETYFSEGDFESAILEYEKVIRSYPRGDKIPSALLKEGLAFLKLGDKTDGKLVLKKLIRKFPRTDQAKIAKRVLRKIR